MTKLKLTTVHEEKLVKLTVTLSAALNRNLIAYAEIIARESGRDVEPAKLIAPMLEKFIASDRAFRKARGVHRNPIPKPSAESPASTSDAPD